MARSRLYRCILAGAALVAATPALAQFGSIFRDDGPPRPPADVPGGSNGPPPYYSPSQTPPSQAPYYPTQRDAPPQYPPPQYRQPQYQQPQYQQPQYQQPQYPRQADDANAPRPPANVQSGSRGDVPPAQPMPPPMSLPPSSRPGGGGIQSQELPPPPGAQQAPAEQRPMQPQQPQQANTPPVQPGAAPQPGAQPGAPQDANQPPPAEEVVVEPPPQRIANPTAVFSGLDKITGRTISFDVAINETVQFGALQVTPRVCYSRPPTETPNTDSFVEVDEVTLQGEIKRIFTGWMFAASPGLHAVEHPIYDVWLTDCKGGRNPAVAEGPALEAGAPVKPAAKPPARPARPAPSRPAQPRAHQQSPGFLPALR